MRLCPARTDSAVQLGCRFQSVGMQENIVQCFNRVPGFFFIGIEQPNVLLRTIEVKTGYRFPVVVIQKNTEIALGISGDDALGINLRAYNRFNDVVAFRFFFSRNNQIFLVIC